MITINKNFKRTTWFLFSMQKPISLKAGNYSTKNYFGEHIQIERVHEKNFDYFWIVGDTEALDFVSSEIIVLKNGDIELQKKTKNYKLHIDNWEELIENSPIAYMFI